MSTRPLPTVGEEIYIPATASAFTPKLDNSGGLATIISWKERGNFWNSAPAVRLAGIRKQWNYWKLLEMQESLRAQYGSERARYDPNRAARGLGLPRASW